ncbi:acetyltransferase (GNAT) family protein [Algoriphagus aquaeductus]|jgi:ribosomal protein S18 acetylase RimI-like enzyme|uniref:Acetyltransferase (GNAT) family protein n=1 Tax=Algoriphagus aquaeductus TaxID=475299 RepID=A0A326S0Q7_9BACT|nr:GNAT family N-acetyltransferase [Algoriphagus aquaeductus]PZV87470.1 acetyltransferase (GNAT) family protein [Algoriphagus aquaeductus]
MIVYQLETQISLEEYSIILTESGLGVRRPMEDLVLLQKMIDGSNLLVTARQDQQLIGLLRGLSDFCYRSFVADLAVSMGFQRMGIGRNLIHFAKDLAPNARIFLFSAEDAEGFYQKLGFQLHERCYQLKPEQQLL